MGPWCGNEDYDSRASLCWLGGRSGRCETPPSSTEASRTHAWKPPAIGSPAPWSGQHERAAGSARFVVVAAVETLGLGRAKAACSTGSGLCDAVQTAPAQHGRDGLKLDRRGRGVAFGGKGAEDRRGKSRSRNWENGHGLLVLGRDICVRMSQCAGVKDDPRDQGSPDARGRRRPDQLPPRRRVRSRRPNHRYGTEHEHCVAEHARAIP